MKRWAKITTRFEGFHRYPAAPEEVAFLRNLHRHVFHVTVQIEQYHDARDIEYFLFKRFVEDAWRSITFSPSSSCETMAIALGDLVGVKFAGRGLKVEVSEDGENGALIEF